MGKKRKARSPRTEPRTRTTAAGTCTPDRLSAEGLRGKSVVDNVWAATAFGRKKKDRTPAESRHIAHLTAKCGRLLKIFAVSLQELRTQSSWDADEEGRRGQLVSAPSKLSRPFMEARGLGSGTLPATKPGRSYKTFCVILWHYSSRTARYSCTPRTIGLVPAWRASDATLARRLRRSPAVPSVKLAARLAGGWLDDWLGWHGWSDCQTCSIRCPIHLREHMLEFHMLPVCVSRVRRIICA